MFLTYTSPFTDTDTGLNSSTRRSSESSVVEHGRQPCSHMLYQHGIGLHPFATGSYLISGVQPIPSTSPSATSGSTEPLQQLYDEMYNLDTPLVTLPGTFSPLPPSSPTPATSLGINHSSSRRFSYPNSPVHNNSMTNGPNNPNSKNNLPQISVEPTSNIAAVVAAAEHALNTSNQPLQISKHLQQLRLQHGGKGNEANATSSATVIAPSISNSTTVIPNSSSTVNTSAPTKITWRNNSIPSFSKCLMNTSIDSNSSNISNSSLSSKFSERAAAAKNRWKAKGSITQGYVPQRQMPTASLGSTSSANNSLKTPHTNLAHSHSFDDAFENGKVVTASGSVQLLHRRHTHHRYEKYYAWYPMPNEFSE